MRENQTKNIEGHLHELQLLIAGTSAFEQQNELLATSSH